MSRRQQEVDEDVGSDYSGSDVDEEVNEEVGSDVDQAPVGSEVAAPKQHVKLEGKYANAETVFLDVCFKGSPEDFEKGIASREWNFKQELLRHFKQNMADKDRHLASDDQLAGHIKRIVPMGLRLVQQMDTLPFAGQITNKKMLPKNIHATGAALHRCEPCALTPVNINLFNPVSLIDADMIEKGRMCTPEMVNDTVNIVEPTGKNKSGYGTVVIRDDDGKTLAYKTLANHVRKSNTLAGEKFSREQVRAILSPPAKAKSVEISAVQAAALKARLLKDVDNLLSRCMDLESDLTFHFERADGESSFNSPNMLEGSLIGAVVNAENVADSNPLLTKVGTFYAKLEFRFHAMRSASNKEEEEQQKK